MAMNEQINADADRKTMLYINVEYLNLNESRKHTAYTLCGAVCVLELNRLEIYSRVAHFGSQRIFGFLYN